MDQFSIKHRPRFFAEIIGQDTVRDDLLKRASTRKWPRAMLLKGMYGTGKTTAAQLIAMAIQCKAPDASGNACGMCPSCSSIINEKFDRDTMRLDGGTVGKKDDMLEFMSILNVRPMQDKARVFIIEEADQLSTGAANALLKTLEAPQANIHFILLSMTSGGVSSALQSRCQVFFFKPLATAAIMRGLKAIMTKEGRWDDPSIPDSFKLEGLATLASSSKGSMREAVQYLDKCLDGGHFTVEQIREALGVVDEAMSHVILRSLLKGEKDESIMSSIFSADPAELYNYMTLILSEVMLYKTTGYINSELYVENTKSLAPLPHVDLLFKLLSDSALLTKPYIRKADLISTIAKFYSEIVATLSSACPQPSAPVASAVPVRQRRTS